MRGLIDLSEYCVGVCFQISGAIKCELDDASSLVWNVNLEIEPMLQPYFASLTFLLDSGHERFIAGNDFSTTPTCTLPQRACETYKLDTRLEEGEQVGYRMAYSKENYRIKHYEFPPPDRDLCGKLRTVHSKEVYQAVLKSRSKLQSAQSEYVGSHVYNVCK